MDTNIIEKVFRFDFIDKKQGKSNSNTAFGYPKRLLADQKEVENIRFS